MANTSVNMAASLGITSSEPRELKLGASFSNQGPLFHTLRYDFKPASVDVHKVATVEVNDKNGKEVMVTVPHNDGAGTPHTVFKGNQCPIKKDCVLIINKTTGEMTLEKLHTGIVVKKTRFEAPAKLAPPTLDPLSLGRKPSPKHRDGRGKASPKPSSLGCIPKHSPLHASPNPSLPMIGEDIDPGYDDPRPSSQTQKSLPDFSKQDRDSGVESNKSSQWRNTQDTSERDSKHRSLSKVPGHVSKKNPGERVDGRDTMYKPARPQVVVKQPSPEITFTFEATEPEKPAASDPVDLDDIVGVLSDSSSDDSGSESGSSSSSSEPDKKPVPKTLPGPKNGSTFEPSAEILLSDDLQLSDSGSDSD